MNTKTYAVWSISLGYTLEEAQAAEAASGKKLISTVCTEDIVTFSAAVNGLADSVCIEEVQA